MTKNNKADWLAFISYSHLDKKWAKWLQNKLEYYKLPSYIKKENPNLPSSLRPIFRDETDLPLGLLTENIKKALDSSLFLIVICSRNAVSSKYVDDEINYFLQRHKETHIIPFIIDGIPHSSSEEKECFPSELSKIKGDLLAANINELGKDYAAVKVVSSLLGGLDIIKLWNRYEESKEKEQLQLKKLNNHLLDLSSRASSIKAQDLISNESNAFATKIALSLYTQNQKNGNSTPVEVENLLRNATLGNAGEMYRLCSFAFSPNSFPRYITSPDKRFFVISDELMISIFDTLSLNKITTGLGFLFDDIDTYCFNQDCTLYLHCDLRELFVFDIKARKIIFKKPNIYKNRSETAKKAFFIQNKKIAVFSQNTVIVFDVETQLSLLQLELNNIIDACDFHNDLFIVHNNNSLDSSITISKVSLDTGVILTIAKGEKWSFAKSNNYLSILIDNVLIINTPTSSFNTPFVGSGQIIHVSDDGLIYIFNKLTQKAIIYDIANNQSHILLGIKKISISPDGKWGLFQRNETSMYYFELKKRNNHSYIKRQLLHTSNDLISYSSISTTDNHQILIVDDKNVCSLYDSISLNKIGERMLSKEDKYIIFCNSHERFIKVSQQEKGSIYHIHLIEWNPIVSVFVFNDDKQRKEYPQKWNYYSGQIKPCTKENTSRPFTWGGRTYHEEPVSVSVKGSNKHFSDGYLFNSKGKVIVSCENFLKDDIEQMTAFFIKSLNYLVVVAQYSFSIGKILYVWTIKTGSLIFTKKIHSCQFELSYDDIYHSIVFGHKVIEFPPITDIVTCAQKRFKDVELTEEEKKLYYLK